MLRLIGDIECLIQSKARGFVRFRAVTSRSDFTHNRALFYTKESLKQLIPLISNFLGENSVFLAMYAIRKNATIKPLKGANEEVAVY